MLPSAVVVVDRLPVTASGKIDRRALAAREAGTAQEIPASEYVAPRGELEQRIAEIWEELLGTRVGVTDSFFERGGHSLLAMRSLTRISRLFQVEVPLRRFFERPTIEGLAAAIERDVLMSIAAMPEQEASRLADGRALS